MVARALVEGFASALDLDLTVESRARPHVEGDVHTRLPGGVPFGHAMPPVRPPERVRGQLLLVVRAARCHARTRATLSLTELAERLELDEELGAALAELPEGMGMLVVRRGPNAGSRYVLDAEVTALGRHPDSDIFLDDITVSRRHAVVRRVDDGYEVARRRVAQRHLRRPRARRHRAAAPPRRPPDRPVRARVPDRERRACVSTRPSPSTSRSARCSPQLQRRVPRHHDLEDPLPREPGPDRPRAHAVGLPEVLRRRPRAAALDPATSRRSTSSR